MLISEVEADFYHRFGYLVAKAALAESVVKEMRQDIQSLLAQEVGTLVDGGRVRNKRRLSVTDLHLKSEAVRKVLISDFMMDISRRFVGKNVDLRNCICLAKNRAHGEPVEWHQDWGLGKDPGYPMITCWVAVTDAFRENGCVTVIPASHKSGLLKHEKSVKNAPDIGIVDYVPEDPVYVEMKAGQVLILHPQVIHGSDRHLSGQERIALLAGFQVPKPSYNAFWANAGAKVLEDGKIVWKNLHVTEEF